MAHQCHLQPQVVPLRRFFATTHAFALPNLMRKTAALARLQPHGLQTQAMGVGQFLQVRLGLSDGSTLVSRITRESAELLGLAVGGEVLALAKATAVAVVPAPVTGVATGNRLHGTVARLARATAGDEIAVTLACGLQMVGFSAPGLQLKVGQAAVVVFDDAGVVLAIGG